MTKKKTLQLLLITENTCNKQTMKRLRKNIKGINLEVNKIVPFGKKWKKCFLRYTKLTCTWKNVSCATQSWHAHEKMFLALYKVDMHMCYAKQMISLACPKKYLQKLKCTLKQVCIFHLILLGIPSNLILSIKNRGGVGRIFT